MIRVILMLIFLLFSTVYDIKVKKLPLMLLLGFGTVGLIVNIVLPKYSLTELLCGVAVGVALLIVSYVTSGQIGTGDGILFIVMGVFIGGINNLRLLLWASVGCALVAGILLMTKQAGKKDKIPFIPFVFFAYIGQVIL